MKKRNAATPSRSTTPVDPALADAPCADALVDMLTDDVGPALATMLAKVNAAEDAYNGTPALRGGFEHREAEDGWAGLRPYLEHAAAEVRRIVPARR